MDKILGGKTAIVTGGSQGIGEAISRRLASMGADIAVLYVGSDEPAKKVCEDITKEYGVKIKSYYCDVSNFEDAKKTVAQIKTDFGGAAILVNNAGITRDGLIATMKEEDFDAVISVNLKGAYNMIRHCTGLFLRAKEGCIINISSVSGLMGNAGQSNYAASKAGLVGLTKSVAKELAPRGIRCNAIAPGFIQTSMTQSQTENPLLKMIPLARMGSPEDIADAAEFLVKASYVTGEVIKVDGGIAM